MDKETAKELKRLERLDDFQLLDLLGKMDSVPAPDGIKDLIIEKIRSIMNARLGV